MVEKKRCCSRTQACSELHQKEKGQRVSTLRRLLRRLPSQYCDTIHRCLAYPAAGGIERGLRRAPAAPERRGDADGDDGGGGAVVVDLNAEALHLEERLLEVAAVAFGTALRRPWLKQVPVAMGTDEDASIV